jgi:hypothetical protein
MRNGKKSTTLSQINFVGANGKKKHPYELSELLFYAVRNGLITVDKVRLLIDESNKLDTFLDKVPISVGKISPVNINGLVFQESTTALPTYFHVLPDGAQLEVSVQKQQYAAGVQPMLYLCLPLAVFSNGQEISGEVAIRGDKIVYIIDEENVDNLTTTFRVFAMCSEAHRHDVVEILRSIIGN